MMKAQTMKVNSSFKSAISNLCYYYFLLFLPDENNTSRSEIKQRIAEIWQGVHKNELLSNLFLETVCSLYRLPQDGDFGYAQYYLYDFLKN